MADTRKNLLQQRDTVLKRAAWAGILSNLFLVIVKGMAGYVGNSRALVADSLHSASDIITSIIVLVGIRAATKPPDSDHPYGHGKAEMVSAIIVAVLLGVIGIELIVRTILDFAEEITTPSPWVLYIVGLSILVNELLYQVKYRIGRRLNSQALIADAWHHRSDSLSSIAAFAGVGLAVLAGILQTEWLVYADPVVGVLISLMILKMAWEIGYEAVHKTLDHTLHKDETESMRRQVFGIQGVETIDSFRAREHGHYIIVDIKISVSADLNVEEGHKIGKRVKAALMDFERIEDVLVHINPYQNVE